MTIESKAFWNKLKNNELDGNLQFESCEKDGDTMVFRFFCGVGFRNEQDVEKMIREQARRDGFSVRMEFCYEMREFADESEIPGFLTDVIAAERPGYRAMLKKSRITARESVIEIETDDEETRDTFVSSQFGKFLETEIARRCARKYRVTVKGAEGAGMNDGEYAAMLDELDTAELRRSAEERKQNGKKGKSAGTILYGRGSKEDNTPIGELREDTGRATVTGRVIKLEHKELNSGSTILMFDLTDGTGSITAKLFDKTETAAPLLAEVTEGKILKVNGACEPDRFAHETVLKVYGIQIGELPERRDDAPEKRVELHLHTKLSKLDGFTEVKTLFETLQKWGHEAVAITDHGVVQAFPLAYAEGKKRGVKPLLGVEAYLINDSLDIVSGPDERDFAGEYVVFDLETTGLSPISEVITEIGAVKIAGGRIVDRLSTFVNCGRTIPAKITDLTGITNDMIADAPDEHMAVERFYEFAKDAVLVGHNAGFDVAFMRAAGERQGFAFRNTVVDTLSMARALLPDLKRYKLDIVAKRLDIELTRHHRAVSDAETTAHIFLKLIRMAREKGAADLGQINTVLSGQIDFEKQKYHHVIIFAKNKTGLFNLYKLITDSHLEHFYKQPRMLKSLINKRREGLIIGSACEQGEIYRAVLRGASDEDVRRIIDFYDYLEIQPRTNNMFLVREGELPDEQAVLDINKRIVELGRYYNKPVCATCDAHYLNREDGIFRKIILAPTFKDVDEMPDLYLRTTGEMLEEFAYLGREKAYEVVVTNPRRIADQIEWLEPFPTDKLYTPELDGVEEEIERVSYETARALYGENLPEIVEKRLRKELDAIVGNGYTVLYSIARRVVRKSLADGYLVGSRGSVGSSFVATMMGITEVNPLPPHYVCPKCHFYDFDVDTQQYGCGIDLPPRRCPVCGEELLRLGFDIPFEVFMGFKGNKAPDIDLNISGEYQSRSHKYVEELFGKEHVFRAGTISALADKQCFGYVKKYFEERGIPINRAETDRLVRGCTDVKKTTGQHPGGIVVVPKAHDIHEFTPLQYPADDTKCGIITTHFDFTTLHDTLVKLDLLGHDDPTMIRHLYDLTGVDPKTIPLNDEKVMSLFLGTEALGVTPEQIGSEVGTYGVPEFGTGFVRKMLVETRPTSFAELIHISGLSHGTNVWTDNAQTLIRSGAATLKDVICTREDIMLYLVRCGVEAIDAFAIMESVRKGKGLKPEMKEIIRTHNLPDWYMDSCLKIQYMFPKAHAAAYIMMALRIAYYKVYFPKEFYATYYTIRADFDITYFDGGPEKIREALDEFEKRGDLNAREKGVRATLEIGLEMFERGIRLDPIDIFKSRASEFYISEETGNLVPPFTAIAGLGASVADSIVEAREEKPFASVDDIIKRTKAGKSNVELLKNMGVIHDLPEKGQVSIFEL